MLLEEGKDVLVSMGTARGPSGTSSQEKETEASKGQMMWDAIDKIWPFAEASRSLLS